MKNYNYKIEAINKATGYMFEPAKFTDENKFNAAVLSYCKISSSVYLYKKVSGKWEQTLIIKPVKAA